MTIHRISYPAITFFLLAFISGRSHGSESPQHVFPFKPGDHICVIGNTLADRMQHHGWLESYIHALHPKHQLTFRNLGFPGDEVTKRPRSDNFGSADQWLTKCQADVVFCFFGYNETLRYESALDGFARDMTSMIEGMLAQKYNGKSAPRLVVFSPLAHENLNSPHLPDGSKNNRNLELAMQTMREVCANQGVLFVDLFTPSQRLYTQTRMPLTMNGIHLLDHGNQAMAKGIVGTLFPESPLPDANRIDQIRNAVLEKNYYWFSRYRVVDGYNVYGGRSKLAWHDQSNADVMRREMEVFDVMTENRDRRVWAVAQGGDLVIDDTNVPALLKIKTNKQGPNDDGSFPYLSGQNAITKMTVAKGMKVNLFASEERFPQLVNPVQMAVDTDGRLWASVWPSYPHWNPTQPRKDALIILPDDDGDGVADKCTVFADQLNSITGFEFWGGGVLVAAPPEIWFLKDSDGDDKADVKIRVLQGISSADTHHSANAMLIGPDGWLYWSRGIFNVANFETPTKTYRSGKSGVHRFNPRTFEVEFHFPIGPNPHGDTFDQWGFQFANDGTSGTGSYVNIGKGIGNKHWFKKRVRPVAAIGILSSSHFPEANNGNFLVCNTIGFLGVLQHKVSYQGADITANEVEPIVVSTDPNFRPSDLEVGADGALYISDWHNVLIGHMQHNMRDPNRDHAHGRIYRVTYPERDLLKPPKLKSKSILEVCDQFFAKENGARYRARLELSGRPTADVVRVVSEFTRHLDPLSASAEHDEGQALLECLWVHEEHRVPNMNLLHKVFQSQNPRVRAAAVRTLGHWSERVDDWEATLIAAARDDAELVRAEAVKTAVNFTGLTAAEAIFEVATQPTDSELETVLEFAKSQINLDVIVRDAIASGIKLSVAAQTYVLEKAPVADLLKLEPSAPIYRAILSRKMAKVIDLSDALSGLATATGTDSLDLLMGLIADAEEQPDGNLSGLGKLLVRYPANELYRVRTKIEQLAVKGRSLEATRLGYIAWVAAAGPDDAFLAASQAKDRLRTFLDAVPSIDEKIRSQLYDKVEKLIFDMPANLMAEREGAVLQKHGIRVDYFYPSASDVAVETLAKMEPKASGFVPVITMDVPQRDKKDKFALRFTGAIQIPQAGRYTFYTNSDDGSRLYIGGTLVVNNDGTHGMSEKKGSIDLPHGAHSIVVTYFDHGGDDGLKVQWEGPDMAKQNIAAESLTVSGGENLHDRAIRALASIPGNDARKFKSLASLIAAGRHRPAAINSLLAISKDHWSDKEVPQLIDNLIGYLSEIPVRYRTGGPAMDAVMLAKSLAKSMPAEQKKSVDDRLGNLDVRVIAIGTVPQRMIFDKELIAVQAGKPVEFRFSNIDAMPHNFAITIPGSLAEVGELGEATGREANAEARHYIPVSDKILLASRLLQPGDSQALSFQVPVETGVYPYVCTFPGHWRRMYGALVVIENLEEYQADPKVYLAAHPIPIQDELLKLNTRRHQWTYEELISEVRQLPPGRSFEIGRELFKVASCVGCHQLNNEGQVFGPDLAKLDEKKHTTEHILQSILEPSKLIEEKYQSHLFQLDSGKIITGMILDESDDIVRVVIDPLAKDKATVIDKDSIETRETSKISIMPQGMLDKLSQEEILDLIAYVFARGDQSNALFEQHQHHHNH